MDRSTVRDILGQIIHGEIKPSRNGFNFSCVRCGDSTTDKSKKRGWILFKGDMTTYHCFNCDKDQSISFAKFVKEQSPELYRRYFRNRNVKDIFKPKAIEVSNIVVHKKTSGLEDLSDFILPHSFGIMDKVKDPILKKLQKDAISTILKRKIPKKYAKTFLVCHENIPFEDDELKFKNRLIIPFYDNNGHMYCFQGRALLDYMIPKYMTWNKDNIKIFNFYNVDKEEDVFVFEGPIDAMFISNAIATSGLVRYDTEQYHTIIDKFKNRVWVFDNDESGWKQALKFLEHGERVFIFPKSLKDFKDINEIIEKKVLTKEGVSGIIFDNVYKGMKGVVKLKMMHIKEN